MKPSVQEVIIVPKLGELLALDVLHRALNAAQIDNKTYFDLLERAKLS